MNSSKDFNWGTTSDWAGTGPHVKKVLNGDCCPGSTMERMDCQGGNMTITDRDTREVYEVYK